MPLFQIFKNRYHLKHNTKIVLTHLEVSTPCSQSTKQWGQPFQVPADPLNSFYIYGISSHGPSEQGSCASGWVKSSYRAAPYPHFGFTGGLVFLSRAWALWWGWVYRRVKLQVFQPEFHHSFPGCWAYHAWSCVLGAESKRVELLQSPDARGLHYSWCVYWSHFP